MLSLFSRLSVTQSTRSICTSSKLLFRSTPILCAEPLKKKKKIDPQVVRQREERRRKKIEKQIRRLEKNARQLKPIDEMEVPLKLIDEKDKYARNVSVTAEQLEQRDILTKQWSKYRLEQKLQNFKKIDSLLMAQEKALQELRFESEELYQEAIQPDLNLIPFSATGPVSTPPIKDYLSPDGEYIDVSKKWE